MVVDAVSQEVNVPMVVPHAGQFNSRHDFNPAFCAGRYRLIDPCDAVVVAEGNSAQPGVTRQCHELCRRAEPVGTGAVQVEVYGSVQVN